MSPVLQKREAAAVEGTSETLSYAPPEAADQVHSLAATEATNVGEYFAHTQLPWHESIVKISCSRKTNASLSIKKRQWARQKKRAAHHWHIVKHFFIGRPKFSAHSTSTLHQPQWAG